MGQASSEDLVRRAARGDRHALISLLEVHGTAVRDQFQNDIPKRWQAVLGLDDLMQETFTDAFLDIQEFTPSGANSFQAWLATIARNNLLNCIRSLEADKRGGDVRQIQPDSDESFLRLFEELGCTTTTPSRVAAAVEARTAVGVAVERLPADYREVVQRYDLCGEPAANVAAVLGRSTGAMFMLRSRAHRALRKILGSSSGFLTGSS